MPTLDDARNALADAVTSAGLVCSAYPPDNPSVPGAFVDDLGIDFSGGQSTAYFCLAGSAIATIVTLAQRNDRPSATKYLEGLVPGILQALYAIPGVRIVSASSGSLNVQGQDLPAMTYSIAFLT